MLQANRRWTALAPCVRCRRKPKVAPGPKAMPRGWSGPATSADLGCSSECSMERVDIEGWSGEGFRVGPQRRMAESDISHSRLLACAWACNSPPANIVVRWQGRVANGKYAKIHKPPACLMVTASRTYSGARLASGRILSPSVGGLD